MTRYAGLTNEICASAWSLIMPAVASGANTLVLNKHGGHVVVLKPNIPYEPKYRNAVGDGTFDELVLWERAFGNPDEYDLEKYKKIARAKAFTTYLTGTPSHQVQQVSPFLYLPGMTKWGGSAISGTGPVRLITAFSGVQWSFDQMIAEWMISAITALCLEEMRAIMASDEAMM